MTNDAFYDLLARSRTGRLNGNERAYLKRCQSLYCPDVVKDEESFDLRHPTTEEIFGKGDEGETARVGASESPRPAQER